MLQWVRYQIQYNVELNTKPVRLGVTQLRFRVNSINSIRLHRIFQHNTKILFSIQPQQKLIKFSKKSKIPQKQTPMILKLNLSTNQWEDQRRRRQKTNLTQPITFSKDYRRRIHQRMGPQTIEDLLTWFYKNQALLKCKSFGAVQQWCSSSGLKPSIFHQQGNLPS